MNLTIEKYIATNNQPEAMLFLKNLGAPKPKDEKDLVNKLQIATLKFGDKAFEQLAEIDTPYRRLILSKSSESKSNCGGGCEKCSGADGTYELENFYQPKSETPSETPTAPAVPEVIKQAESYFKLHPIAKGVGITLLSIAVIAIVAKSVK